MNPTRPALPLADLEAVYDALAIAVDRAGPEQAPLMLVKLALLLAQDLGDRPRFEALLAAALADLNPSPPPGPAPTEPASPG